LWYAYSNITLAKSKTLGCRCGIFSGGLKVSFLNETIFQLLMRLFTR
jgi:hypothetical protein